MNRLELKFSTSAEISRAVFQMLNRLLNAVRMSEESRNRFMLCVGEAMDNAVIHGNRFSPDKFIDVEYMAEPKRITFMVADQGSGFDYQKHLAVPLDEFQAPKLIDKTIKFGSPGGLGLALIRKCCDEITFTPPGNRVAFIKYL
ncbi:MAG: ATP-binding protein [Planctomycetota bacterium]